VYTGSYSGPGGGYADEYDPDEDDTDWDAYEAQLEEADALSRATTSGRSGQQQAIMDARLSEARRRLAIQAALRAFRARRGRRVIRRTRTRGTNLAPTSFRAPPTYGYTGPRLVPPPRTPAPSTLVSTASGARTSAGANDWLAAVQDANRGGYRGGGAINTAPSPAAFLAGLGRTPASHTLAGLAGLG
jgi:hypothetical protein